MHLWLFFLITGYLSGSVLFARVAAHVFSHPEILKKSRDHNPGTANAFHYGGFLCGCFVFAGDFLKAFLPVWLYFVLTKSNAGNFWYSAFVVAAPVLGHTFPVWTMKPGGKGITVSFGVFAALWAGLHQSSNLFLLAALFLFFSLILRIRPDYWKTVTVYALLAFFSFFVSQNACSLISALLVSTIIELRLSLSSEKRKKMKVRFL